jgi:Fe-S cluster assembly protein SufB
MIHIGKNTTSLILAKGISAGHSKNTYRGLVQIKPNATGAKNYTKCDSLLIGDQAQAITLPYLSGQNHLAKIEHEAAVSQISAEQLFYFQQRGFGLEEAVSLIINGFCQAVFAKLPAEFAVEAMKLLSLKLA